MTPIVEFLNHGVMPFAGREKEIEQICLFARQTIDAPVLRLSLIVGEAGVGKSRLAAEVMPRLLVEEILPLHVRLYPDTAISIITALAETINHSPRASLLLRKSVDPSLASLNSALRRLSGLRVLVLVVEDLHLLEGNSLREFTQLCSSLFNESISIVALARPLSPEIRSAIEPYLGEEVRLSGLSTGEIASLWNEMLSGESTEDERELLGRLREVSGGNPLTIRSSLRGAFRKGVIGSDGSFEPANIDQITELFRQGALRFGEGLAVHLNQSEREALGTLARLGEVFSHEAAAILLGDATPTLIEQLLFKGVLIEASGAATPLARERSDEPLLRFTHTLVHRQALEQGEERAVDELYHVIARRAPLYSHLPLELITGKEASGQIDRDLLVDLLGSIWTITTYADAGVEWYRVNGLLDLRDQIFRLYGDLFDPAEREEQKILHHLKRAVMLRRDREKLERLSAEGMEMTEGMIEEASEESDESRRGQLLTLRLEALHNRALVEDDRESLIRFFEEAQRAFEIAPDLRRSRPGVNLLRFITLRLAGDSEWEVLRRVESETDPAVLDQEEVPWGVEHLLLMLALVYDTPEEFRRREEQVRRIERPHHWKSVRALYPLLRWYYDAGYLDRYLPQIRPAIDIYRQHEAQAYVVMHAGHARLMEYLQRYEEVDVEGALSALPYREIFRGEDCRSEHFELYTSIALMRGEHERAARVAEEVPELAVPCALLLGQSPRTGQGDGGGARAYHDHLVEVNDLLASDEHLKDQTLELILKLLARPPLRITDPLLLMAALELGRRGIEIAEQKQVQRLQEGSAEAIGALLDWYLDEKRRIVPPAEHLLQEYGEMLGEEERRSRERELRRARQDQLEREEFDRRSESERAHLRVIGQIAIRHPDEEERTLRGERVSTCIGALVANTLLSRPLEMVDFARLATGEEEPDHARKILKVALFRTREALGPGAVEQGDREHGPTIDRSVLSVDLLDLADSISEGGTWLAEGALTRALREAHRAIELFGEEVILPGLYDRIFEAVREEQEARLRSLVVRLAERLIEEGDLHSAELLLRHAIGGMPEDEELAELLQEVLREQGNLTGAELIDVG